MLRLLPGSPGLRVMRLFGQRPGRPPLSLRQYKAMAQARALQLPGCGSRPAAWSWGHDPAPTVMLVHGWGGCAAQLAPLAVHLARAGLRCVARDVTGHGHAPGARASLRHFVDDTAALAAVIEGTLLACVGHSAGGLAVAAARGIKGLHAQRYVCIGTPAAPTPDVRAMQRWLAPRPALLAAYAEHLAGHFGTSWQTMECGECFAGLGHDLLHVQDEQDRVVDPREADRIHAWCAGSTLLKTSGLGHTRVLESPQLAQATAAFLGCSG